jgi:hypothetical protein
MCNGQLQEIALYNINFRILKRLRFTVYFPINYFDLQLVVDLKTTDTIRISKRPVAVNLYSELNIR